MKCAGCSKTTKETNVTRCTSLTCDKCFCTLCVPLASSAEKKKTWKCPDCSVQSNTGSELAGFTNELRNLTKEISSLKCQLEDVTKSMCFCHSRLDEIVASLKTTDKRLKVLEQRDNELNSLKATVIRLEDELHTQRQNDMKNEIEIIGIPETQNVTLQHSVQIVAQKLGVELKEDDVDYITRVGPRRPAPASEGPNEAHGMSRPVVVRLLRRSKRDALVQSSRSRRNLNTSDLQIPGAARKIYLNERLTKENRQLFRDARIRSKNGGYTFCWCNNGAIYVREKEKKPAVRIRSLKDLDRIFPPLAATAK